MIYIIVVILWISIIGLISAIIHLYKELTHLYKELTDIRDHIHNFCDAEIANQSNQIKELIQTFEEDKYL